MSAPEAQYNDEDAGRPLASRPLLTDVSVRLQRTAGCIVGWDTFRQVMSDLVRG